MTDFLTALTVVFLTAGVFLLLANQLRLPSVPFYILAGIVAGLFIAEDPVLELAIWGIAFLVFVFGLQVKFRDFHTVLRDAEGAALAQLLLVAPLAFGIGYLLGGSFGFEDPIRNALYFTAAATLSSTLVGGNLLKEEIRNNLVHGRLAASVHFSDDIVAIAVLLVLSAETLTDAQLITSNIGYGVLFLVAGVVLYRYVFPHLVAFAGDSDELVLMGSISILIAFLGAAELVNISIVVGAFAAGIAVRSEGPRLLGVRSGIESIRDFFVAIFFVTLGALVSIPTLEAILFAAVLTVLILVIGPLIHMSTFMLEGYDARTGFLAGANLAHVSELSLVIAIQAWLILETIEGALFDAIVLTAAVTMIVTAIATPYKHQLFEAVLAPVLPARTEFIDRQCDVPADLTDHVVLIGYGRLTRQFKQRLDDLSIPYVVIENDPVLRDEFASECENYVFGDAMSQYVLDKANVGQARLVISTVDHRPLSRYLLSREIDADVLLRSDSSVTANELLDAGAEYVIVPNILASGQLIANLESLLRGDVTVEELREAHRRYLTALEYAEQRHPSDGR